MISFVKGDILATNYNAYAHGCNLQGVMGAGFAGQLAKLFPMMVREYQAACIGELPDRIVKPNNLVRQPVPQSVSGQVNRLTMGGVHCWWGSDPDENVPAPPVIFNLGTQLYPGPYADIMAIRQAVIRMLDYAANATDIVVKTCATQIAMSAIGAGIGGLQWDLVKETLIEVATPSPIELVVCEQYIAGKACEPI